MKKRYVISGLIICFIVVGIYLQFGREEMVINTKVNSYEDGYEQEVCIVANKLFIWDREKYAKELVEKVIQNKFRNVHFSYDVMRCPDAIRVSVYYDKVAYKCNYRCFSVYIPEREKKDFIIRNKMIFR